MKIKINMSRKLSRFFYWLTNDPNVILVHIWTQIGIFLPDKLFLCVLYRLRMGYWMNFKTPKTFTEKLQWLKLYNRRPEYTNLVDKYAVKEYVAQMVGQEYIIPTYAVYDRVEDIDWDKLPNQFVMKTTNGGGGNNVFICTDKSTIDKEKVSLIMTQSLQYNIYKYFGEWPYKGVKPRIIIEELLQSSTGDIRDYKFYCFNGIPRLLLVASNRFTSHNFNYLDIDYNPITLTSTCGKPINNIGNRPENYDIMVNIAKKLSKNMPHVRVDLYNCDGKVYFGELTFFDASGYDNLNSEEWNRRLGDWIVLPKKYQ